MAKAKRSGASHKSYYTNYKNSKAWSTNRRKKLERALKHSPENAEEINRAMANIKYRRKTPTVPKWSATTRRIAELFKLFQGKVPAVAIAGVVPKGRDEEEKYWRSLNEVKNGFLQKADKFSGSMFSIATRISS